MKAFDTIIEAESGHPDMNTFLMCLSCRGPHGWRGTELTESGMDGIRTRDRILELMRQHRIPRENVFIDTTGSGALLADAITRMAP